MTSWLDWEISDEDGDNPLGQPADFEFNVEYDFDPGARGNEYDSYSDGYSGHQANVTLTNAVCKKLRVGDQKQRTPTPDELVALSGWFWFVLDKHPEIRDQIEERGLEQMSIEPDYDDLDD